MRASRALPRAFVVLAVAAAPVAYIACGDDDPSPGTTPSPDASSTTSSSATGSGSASPSADGGKDSGGGPTDAGLDGAIVRSGKLDFDPAGNGSPNGLVWDDAHGKLYIADDRNNQIWSWDDKSGFQKFALVPDDPIADDAGRTKLGAMVMLSNGSLVVARFGYGAVGNVYVITAAGASSAVTGIDQTQKRTALTVGASDKLWNAGFKAGNDLLGKVNALDVTTGETDYALNFNKPVSVLVHDGNLLVADQFNDTIYTLPLDGGATAMTGPYSTFTTVPAVDQIVEGPSDTLFTGQFKQLADGGALNVRQIFADGGYAVIHPEVDLARPQDLVYDKTNKRLFVSDTNGTTVRTIKIMPID